MNKPMIITSIVIMMAGMLHPAYGQDRKLIQKGNELYNAQKYKEATSYYQQAIERNPTSSIGMFNLGNAYYKQKQTDAARKVMMSAARHSSDSIQRAAAQYNLGNTYMDEQKWEEAIEAYKQTLRNNPQDEEARYNLSYARTMLKKEQENKGSNDNQQQNKKDQQQQQQQQQDQQDEQQNKNQQDNQPQEQREDEQQRHPKPMPSKLSEQQAEQILNALQQEEKNLQERQQKEKGMPIKIEKDW